MRKAVAATFAAAVCMTFAGAASADISGVWQGTNYSSKVKGPAQVMLLLSQQPEGGVQGLYWATTGVAGNGKGKIDGTTMTIEWTNTSPNCPGSYKNTYSVNGDQLQWTFTGADCLGPQDGRGSANRLK